MRESRTKMTSLENIRYVTDDVRQHIQQVFGTSLYYQGTDVMELYIKFCDRIHQLESMNGHEIFFGYDVLNETFCSVWQIMYEEDEDDEEYYGTVQYGSFHFQFISGDFSISFQPMEGEFETLKRQWELSPYVICLSFGEDDEF